MSSRADATSRRRQAILDAALECFSTIGFERTTLADIRARSRASTGSIYHHFDSKERIAATLYVEGVRETQEAGVAALLRARTGREGVSALVGTYVGWVGANPAKARFLLGMRHAEFLDEQEVAIIELNRDVDQRTASWMAERIAAGELPDVDPAIRRALIFGPCRHWAGAWLAGRTGVEPAQAARDIATAAYAGLLALSRAGDPPAGAEP